NGPPPTPLADLDPAEFDRVIDSNVRGTFLGLRSEIRAMLPTGGGAIVNMASLAGVRGVANLSGYVAGKAGIIGLTKVAALDYADQGIRVNVVAPGPILTEHLETAGAEAQRLAGQSTPMRRLDRGDDPHRRRPARRHQAAPDVPPGRRHGRLSGARCHRRELRWPGGRAPPA